jgi:ribonuclease J
MVTLTFYGGHDRIGGTKILLDDGKGKTFLDFGKDLERENEYFEFPTMRPFFVPDLILTGLLPTDGLSGLYRHEAAPSPIAGVAVTHAHIDHYGDISSLAEGTPVHLGEVTRLIIEARTDTYQSSWENAIDHLDVRTFRTGDEVELEGTDTVLRPVHVDHSVPAAYGFIVHAGDRTIAYTGDFRVHGHRPDLTEDFLKAAEAEDVHVMLCEGTNAGREDEETTIRKFEREITERMGRNAPERARIDCATEEEVEESLTAEAEASDSLMLVETSPVDLDRIRTAWRVAERTGRALVLEDRQAYVALRLAQEGRIEGLPGPRDALLHLRRARKRKQNRQQEDEEEYEAYRRKWQKTLIGEWESGRGVLWGSDGRRWLRQEGGVLMCTSSATRVLQDLSYAEGPFPLRFFLSKSEPFTEELVLTFRKLLHWLALFGVEEYTQIHVSGHCSPDDLLASIERVNPDLLIPIHTKRAEFFEGVHPNILQTPELGRHYEI